MSETKSISLIIDLATEVLLRSLIELQRELARRGLTAEELLRQAADQTASNESTFSALLEEWRTRPQS